MIFEKRKHSVNFQNLLLNYLAMPLESDENSIIVSGCGIVP